MMSEDSRKSICSPEEDCGASPPVSPDGPTTSPCGPLPARVSRSRKPAKALATMTRGICGRTWFDSSMIAVELDSSLLAWWESKLAARLASIGSTECELIWRHEDTNLGWSRSRLARWTPHTSEIESIGLQWPTPQARDGFPPHTPEYVAKHKANGHGMANLNDYLVMTPWPMPTAADVQGGCKTRSGNRSDEPLLNGLMTWSTPRASDGEKGGPNMSFGAGGQPLPAQMHQASPWVTPSTRDWKDTPGMATEREDGRSRLDQLPRQMAANESATWPTPTVTDAARGNGTIRPHDTGIPLVQRMAATAAIGPTPSGSSVTTEKRGVPDPRFACWLMGFPDAWTFGALQAMLSRPSSRRKSSPRSVKP